MLELRSGDSIIVEGNVEHRATALEDSEVLDVFTPCREDYVRIMTQEAKARCSSLQTLAK